MKIGKRLALAIVVATVVSLLGIACAQQTPAPPPPAAPKTTATAPAATTSTAAPKTTTAPPAAAPATIVLKIAHDEPLGGSKDMPAQKFKELIEPRSQGQIKVEVYPAAQLYASKPGVEAVRAGTIFAQIATEAELGAFDPSFEIASIWGLFKDREHLRRFYLSANGGQKLVKRVEDRGLIVYWSHAGAAYLWTKKPATKLTDVKGLKMRSRGIAVEEDSIKAVFNTDPINVPAAELAVAAQQGMVDGTVTMIVTIVGRGIHEVFKYCADDPIFYYITTMPTVSKTQVQKLPADLQKLVMDTLKDAFDATWPVAWKVVEDTNRDRFLKEKGTFTKIEPAELPKIMEALKPVIAKHTPKIGADFIAEAERLRQ